MAGYTQTELDDVQAKWALRFPPDLIEIYRERRRVIEHEDERFCSFDWIAAPDAVIRDALDWPLKGFLFDVERGLWWPEWGEMPAALGARREKFKTIFSQAPGLIPICGHRCLPQTPCEAGNPVFSVWQMDVIHYGADLEHYARRENLIAANDVPLPPIKHIAFWSRAVELNNQRFRGGQGFEFFDKGGILPEPDAL